MNKVKVHLYGIPRSGGTLVWQVFREFLLTPEGGPIPPQTHRFVKNLEGYKIFLVVRDPREIAFSHWRIYFGKHDKNGNLLNRPNTKDLLGCVDSVKNRLMTFYTYLTYYRDEEIIILRYEDFFNNVEHLLDIIEMEFFIPINVKKRAEVMEKVSLENNKKKSIKLMREKHDFGHYDKSDHIHAMHIGTPNIGEYRKYLTIEQARKLEESLDFELKFLNYK